MVEGSELSRLSVGTAAGGKAYWNRVEDNDFFPAPNPNPNIIDTSIQLAGCGTEKNVVTGNRMAPPKGPPGFGLMIFANASNNHVTYNTFTRSVFLAGGATGNEVSGNVIMATAQPGMAGVEIQTMNTSCLGVGGWMGASNNVILENEIRDGDYGVALRCLRGASCSGNEIRGNVISRPRNAGLAFSTWTDNNDGRQNRVNAPVYAIDYGTGNLWP